MAKRKVKPGPSPETLKIKGDWKKAVKKAVGVERPEGGWPEPDNRQGAKRGNSKKRSR